LQATTRRSLAGSIHALQDAERDLQNWPSAEQTWQFDAQLARKSLIEGEATFYQYRVAAPLLGLDIKQANFDAALREQLGLAHKRAFESETPLRESFRTFPYAYGAQLAYSAWSKGGPRGTDPLWAAPPATTQQVMAMVLGMNEPQATGVEIALPDLTETTLEPRDGDVLGAWGLRLLLEKRRAPKALELALTWRGDQFSVFTDGAETETYVLWQIELESAEAAAELDSLFGARDPFGHRVSGARLYLNAAYDAQPSPELAAWGERWLSGN
jgi:hypothetical protein